MTTLSEHPKHGRLFAPTRSTNRRLAFALLG